MAGGWEGTAWWEDDGRLTNVNIWSTWDIVTQEWMERRKMAIYGVPEIEDERWGYEIRAFFRDPDGHLFEISQVENIK